MGWLRTIPPEAAEGRLARSYAAAVARAGKVWQIVRAMSLAPRVLDGSMGFYAAVMLAPEGLARRQREMLAIVVSRTNGCHY